MDKSTIRVAERWITVESTINQGRDRRMWDPVTDLGAAPGATYYVQIGVSGGAL